MDCTFVVTGGCIMMKVLIIDENQFSGMLATQYLNCFGFDVMTLTSPCCINEIINDYQPEIVVVDADMKTADGMRLSCMLRHSRNEFNRFKLVLFSSNNEQYMKEHIDSGLASGYYMKSITYRGFETALEKAA